MKTAETDLGQLEKQAFRKFYEDGLFDVFLGVVLLYMPLVSYLDDRVEGEPLMLVIVLVLYMGTAVALKYTRTNLLKRRLGTFKPSVERQKKTRAVRTALIISVVLGVVLFVVTGWLVSAQRSDLLDLVPAVWFVNATIIFGAMGYYLDVPRFIPYGVLMGITLPMLAYPEMLWGVEVPVLVAFGLPAAVMIAIGLYKLVNFLRDYPVRENGVALDGN